jgi:hypothetical protein
MLKSRNNQSSTFSRSPGLELFSEAIHLTDAAKIRRNEPWSQKYPHGRSQGYSNVGSMTAGVTSRNRAAHRPVQRIYPHGRSLGFESVRFIA